MLSLYFGFCYTILFELFCFENEMHLRYFTQITKKCLNPMFIQNIIVSFKMSILSVAMHSYLFILLRCEVDVTIFMIGSPFCKTGIVFYAVV